MLVNLKNTVIPKRLKKKNSKVRLINRKEQEVWSQHTPVVHPGIERSNDIKAATNFRSEKEMLAYIIIVCNGDWERMSESVTGIMTWYEEWYFFFEFIWGRTFSTWSAATRKKAYGMKKQFLSAIALLFIEGRSVDPT